MGKLRQISNGLLFNIETSTLIAKSEKMDQWLYLTKNKTWFTCDKSYDHLYPMREEFVIKQMIDWNCVDELQKYFPEWYKEHITEA